jgi:hypothetical protein
VRLRTGIHNEEAERREGEDWSIARECVRALLLNWRPFRPDTCIAPRAWEILKHVLMSDDYQRIAQKGVNRSPDNSESLDLVIWNGSSPHYRPALRA